MMKQQSFCGFLWWLCSAFVRLPTCLFFGVRCRSLACVCTRVHVRGRPRLISSPQWKHGGHPCLPGCVTAIAYPGHVILSVMRMLRSYLLCMQRASSSRTSCRQVDK